MNYRHAYHAGNFADVVKHIALVAVLLHLRKKDTPFAAIDTHAGRGLYDISAREAVRTGEALAGIAKLRELHATKAAALASYLDLAASWGDKRYPGSPLFAARLLRPQDRLVAIEKHPEETTELKKVLQPYPKARVELGDGFTRLRALLPPAERRGVVLIDPPYESETEFADVAKAVGDILKRFATAIILVWFPIKSKSEADSFCGEVLAHGVTKALRADIAIDVAKKDAKDRLASAGLLVINPPYEFDQEMQRALDVVTGPMQARSSVNWLANG